MCIILEDHSDSQWISIYLATAHVTGNKELVGEK